MDPEAWFNKLPMLLGRVVPLPERVCVRREVELLAWLGRAIGRWKRWLALYRVEWTVLMTGSVDWIRREDRSTFNAPRGVESVLRAWRARGELRDVSIKEGRDPGIRKRSLRRGLRLFVMMMGFKTEF